MIEIERKFLVLSNSFKSKSFKETRIIQGFLNTDPERTVRVRLVGEQGVLTVKGKSSNDGLKRFEWEKNISKSDAESLLDLCKKGVIDKIRYYVEQGQHTFEVDEFFGDNQGLIIAEVELQDENEAFERPEWLGKEVTGEVKYYNAELSKTPYSIWESKP